jgi:preprotein translocase subunit SecA
MAGRGTDIMLGGNPEFIAAADLRNRGLSPVSTPEQYEAAWPDALAKAKASVAVEHEEVVGSGGLYVLGTERHESRRIDNQLRGRSGRQGDPGLSRFYLSLGDDLMRLFNAGAVEAIMDRLNIPEDVPIESKMVSRAIRSAQTQVEQQNFEIRKNVLKYDEVLNRQRTVIYDERRKVLSGADLHEQVRGMIDDTVESYVLAETSEGYPEDWDLAKLWTALKTLYPVGIPLEAVEAERESLSADYLIDELRTDAQQAYDRREAQLGEGPDGQPVLRELERRVLLSVMDRKWREHLYEMDYLQEGIGLRAMGQRDPLVEYQREGFDMFTAMMDAIKEESVGFLFNVEVQVEEAPPPPVELIATGPGEVAGEVFVEHLLTDAEPTPAHEVPAAPSLATPPPPMFAAAPKPPEPAQPEDPAPAATAAETAVGLTAGDVPVAPATPDPGTAEAAAAPEAPAAEAAPAGSLPPGVPPAPVTPAAELTPPGAPPAPAIPAAPAEPSAPAEAAPAAPSVVPPAAAAPPAAPAAPAQPAQPVRTAGLPDSFGRPERPTALQYSAPTEQGGVSTTGGSVDPLTGQVTSGGPSRNAPCPCGSGRKYKRCHGDPSRKQD